jgi:hypothetical protein
VKVAVWLPAGTKTEVGVVAAALLLVSVTVTPPVGAAALSVIVPVEDAKLATLVGATATDETVTPEAGVMVSAAVLLTLL